MRSSDIEATTILGKPPKAPVKPRRREYDVGVLGKHSTCWKCWWHSAIWV
jgi:hypothetical protein